MTDKTLLELAKRVESLDRPDNAVDVLCEVALHTTGGQHTIRPNFAGTKVVYTRVSDSKEHVCWADDWTDDNRRERTAAALRAIGETK